MLRHSVGGGVGPLIDQKSALRCHLLKAGGHIDHVTHNSFLIRRCAAEANHRLPGRDRHPGHQIERPRLIQIRQCFCNRSEARTARSASSSCEIGAPKMANTPSPISFSSRPPYRSTSVRTAA